MHVPARVCFSKCVQMHFIFSYSHSHFSQVFSHMQCLILITSIRQDCAISTSYTIPITISNLNTFTKPLEATNDGQINNFQFVTLRLCAFWVYVNERVHRCVYGICIRQLRTRISSITIQLLLHIHFAIEPLRSEMLMHNASHRMQLHRNTKCLFVSKKQMNSHGKL